MTDAVSIFISGITGVFFGMALLYISIKIMGKIADRFEAAGRGKKE